MDNLELIIGNAISTYLISNYTLMYSIDTKVFLSNIELYYYKNKNTENINKISKNILLITGSFTVIIEQKYMMYYDECFESYKNIFVIGDEINSMYMQCIEIYKNIKTYYSNILKLINKLFIIKHLYFEKYTFALNNKDINMTKTLLEYASDSCYISSEISNISNRIAELLFESSTIAINTSKKTIVLCNLVKNITQINHQQILLTIASFANYSITEIAESISKICILLDQSYFETVNCASLTSYLSLLSKELIQIYN
jgi:hypothetical protein